jgi:hypothetical protein
MARASARFAIGAAAAIAAAAAVIFIVRWASAPEPPPVTIAPPRFPVTPQAHPVIPPSEEPVAKPAQAFCEVRDLGLVAMALRKVHAQAVDVAKRAAKKGSPISCRAPAQMGEDGAKLAQAVNDLSARTGACVARDAELDSQWNQLDSAALALGRCNDCTHPRDDRLTGCKRVIELIASAESSMDQ